MTWQGLHSEFSQNLQLAIQISLQYGFLLPFKIGNYKARYRSSKRDKHMGGKGCLAKCTYPICLPSINLCTLGGTTELD